MTEFTVCQNPDILRVIYFIKILIDIIKIVVPIALILLVTIDCAKGVISSENKVSQTLNINKNRLISAILIFSIPTVVNIVTEIINEKTGYESCWANANLATIEKYQVLYDAIEQEKTFEIVFDTNGGSILYSGTEFSTKTLAYTVEYSESNTVNLISDNSNDDGGYYINKTDDTFLGWSEGDESCTNPIAAHEISVTKDTTFYACWQNPDTESDDKDFVNISFDANGGTIWSRGTEISVQDLSLTAEKVSMENPSPIIADLISDTIKDNNVYYIHKPNSIFLGWSEGNDKCTNTVSTDKISLNKGVMKFYACWGKYVENKNPEYTDSNSHTSSISGIKYMLYNQCDSRWGGYSYNNDTLCNDGCPMAAEAVVASAYDANITPLTIYNDGRGHRWPSDNVEHYTDFSCVRGWKSDSEIISNLKKGNVAIIMVSGKNGGGKSKFTSSQHYMALIDISADGKQIFVGNSYGSGTGTYNRNGWFKASVVLESVSEVHMCTPSKNIYNKFN